MKIETKMIFKQEGKKLGNRNKNIDKLCQINNELRKELIVNEGKDAWKIQNSIEMVNEKIKQLETKLINGTIFHSHARWIWEGENTLNIFLL